MTYIGKGINRTVVKDTIMGYLSDMTHQRKESTPRRYYIDPDSCNSHWEDLVHFQTRR